MGHGHGSDAERIVRLEERVSTTFHRLDTAETLLGKAATDIQAMALVQVAQSHQIGLLIKCVFGTVGLVLLAVGGALVKTVVTGMP